MIGEFHARKTCRLEKSCQGQACRCKVVLECTGVRRILRRRKREADGSRRTKRHPVLNQNFRFSSREKKFS